MIARRGAKYIVTIYDPVKRDKRWVGTFDVQAAREAGVA